MNNPKKHPIRYEVILQESDNDSEDIIIPLPLPLLQQLGWKEGENIEIGVDEKGRLYLRKAN